MSKPGTIRAENRYLLYFAVFWVVFIGGVAYLLNSFDLHNARPNQQLASYTDGVTTKIELGADRQGHYRVDGTINNHIVTFILDTGATTVAVSDSIAQKTGLIRGRPGFSVTAAGTVNVWSTTIPELRLGDMTFHNVPGTISPSMDSDMVLLGMSVLKQMNFSQQSGVLTLSLDTR